MINKENLENAEKIVNLSDALNESKADIETMMSHQETMEIKDRETQKNLKEKSDSIYELTKKCQTLEQNVYSLKEKINYYEVFYSEKLGSEEAITKEK